MQEKQDAEETEMKKEVQEVEKWTNRKKGVVYNGYNEAEFVQAISQ